MMPENDSSQSVATVPAVKPAVKPAYAAVAAWITDLQAERDQLRALVESLMTRVEVQAEMLARSAERRGEMTTRVKELEAALAPFAAILVPGWDDGSMPHTAVYPAQLGDLRRAARVLAGTVYRPG